MSELPTCVRTAAGVRELDRIAIEEHGIPGYTLMRRAGEGAFEDLRRHWPDAGRLLIVCGAGNNGGDGYVIARLALEQNLEITVVSPGDTDGLKGDARTAFDDYKSAGGEVGAWAEDLPGRADVVVDAILGTGLDRPLRENVSRIVEHINKASAGVLAIDVPTGLNSDNGEILGAAINADVTATFVGLKQGFYLGHGIDCTGTIEFHDLGVPPHVQDRVPCSLERIDQAVIAQALPRRPRTSHKGDSGHVLLVGGGPGLAGAILLAGSAALEAGAGLVTVATRPEHVELIIGSRPELMCRGVEEPTDLEDLLARASVIALGPGLGQTAWAKKLFAAVIEQDCLKVLDADALNLLAEDPMAIEKWILTPHPGEAGRLLNTSAAKIQADRLGSVTKLAEQYGGIAVLKGAGTLIAKSGVTPRVCDRGNPGMAAPGMGDVLTGVTAAVAAQYTDPVLATQAAVLIHALAGDQAALSGERGTHAGELLPHIRQLVNP